MPWGADALVGVFYDDGLYAVLARSLADGHGYRMLHLPAAPPGVHYPPGYPLLLSLLMRAWRDFPANVVLLRAANVVLFGLFAALASAYLGERLTLRRPVAAALVAAACLAVPLLAVTTVLFSEPLFLVLLVGACWSADVAAAAAGRRAVTLAALAGLLAGAAALTRSIGVAAAFGGVLALVVARRWREAAATAAAPLLLLVSWQVWVRAHHAAVDPLIAANYGTYGDFVGQGGWQLSLESLAALAGPLAAITMPPIGPARVGIAVIAAAVLVVGIAALPRRTPALGWTLLAYLAIVAAWPYGPDRFLWAALPLLAAAFALGVLALWRVETPDPRARATVRALAALAALGVAAGYGWYEARALTRGAATSAQRGISATMRHAVTWVREATDSSAVVATEDEALIWLYTGRKAVPNYLWRVRGRRARDLGPDSLRVWLLKTGATHLLLSGRGSDAAPTVDALLQLAPGMLDLVRVWPEGVMAFAVRPPSRDPARSPAAR